MSLKITINPIERTRISSYDIEKVGFGKVFTDHMFSCDFKDGRWQDLRIDPFGKIPMSPTLSALHYGQAIFEGMKVFKNSAGNISFFRPMENLKRLNVSAKRMCMPELPEEIFVEGLNRFVTMDRDWIPTVPGSSLYLRPFMFATDDFLGVKQSDNYKFMIYGCPVNAYYNHNLKVKIEEHYTRGARGGVGFAKCAGNYAAAMYPTKLAQQEGFDQVLWTDCDTHTLLEETGTSNIFVVTKDKVYTPELSDSLLAGVTRQSVIELLQDIGIPVSETNVSVNELIGWHRDGLLTEMFVTGTAATVTNIEMFAYKGEKYPLDCGIELLSAKVKQILGDIRTATIEDRFNWMVPLQQVESL